MPTAPFSTGDADLLLDVDFRLGQTAVEALLVTTHGFSKVGAPTFDSTLGCDLVAGAQYNRTNWAARTQLGTQLTIWCEVRLADVAAHYLAPTSPDYNAKYVDSVGRVADGALHYPLAVAENGAPFGIGFFEYNGIGASLFGARTLSGGSSAAIHNMTTIPGSTDGFIGIALTIDTAQAKQWVYVNGFPMHQGTFTLGVHAVSLASLLYYVSFGTSNGATNFTGYIRRAQIAKRALSLPSFHSKRVALYGDSFVQGWTARGAPTPDPPVTVAQLDAVQLLSQNFNWLTGVATTTNPYTGVWGGGAVLLMELNMIRQGLPPFLVYNAAKSGYGWNTASLSFVQTQSDAIKAYDPAIILCAGSVNDENVTPTTLATDTIDKINWFCDNKSPSLERVIYFETFPGYKGSTILGQANHEARIAQIRASALGSGYTRNGIIVQFVATYEPLGGASYPAEFNRGGGTIVAAYDAAKGTTITGNDAHPFGIGAGMCAELMFPQLLAALEYEAPVVDQVEITLPRLRWNEGSAFTATAAFRNRDDGTSAIPSTAKYRVDCLSTLTVLQAWTSLTPAASISIPITATHNAIQSVSNARERKQLTVSSDPDADDQFRAVAAWDVENLWGSP